MIASTEFEEEWGGDATDDRINMKSYYMCFSLYLLQGMVQAIPATMPYLYPQLPPYHILALFSMTDFPFSLKFLVAPFLEKYTHLDYGKRKTWIIISQLSSFFVLQVASHYTDIQEAHVFSLLLMATTTLIVIQDISLDSLTIKQVRCAKKTSIIQTVAESFGLVIGNLILLKFTSIEFARKIGLHSAITTPKVMVTWIAAALVLASLIMHFCFRETALECEKRGKEKNFWEIVSYSKVFFKLDSKYCRLGILLLLNYQGFNFYEAGYEYEMIKAGFSRDTSNSLSNVIALFVISITFKMTQIISSKGLISSLMIIFSAQVGVYFFNLIVFSQSPYLYAITETCSQVLIAAGGMALYICVYQFPLHGFTGMFTTFLLSLWNLGSLRTIHTLIISVLGWRICALFGLLIQIVIIFRLPALIDWVQKGTVDLDSSILHSEDKERDESTQLATYINFEESELERI